MTAFRTMLKSIELNPLSVMGEPMVSAPRPRMCGTLRRAYARTTPGAAGTSPPRQTCWCEGLTEQREDRRRRLVRLRQDGHTGLLHDVIEDTPVKLAEIEARFGGEIAARVAEHCFDDLDAPVRRLHGAFAPTPYSQPLEQQVVPSPDDIARAIRALMEE